MGIAFSWGAHHPYIMHHMHHPQSRTDTFQSRVINTAICPIAVIKSLKQQGQGSKIGGRAT
jgi:hypothetical protein